MSTMFSMRVLETESGVPARTLRHWIQHRILPKPIGKGRAARYGEEHVLRARAAQRLRNAGQSLRAVRSRLANLSAKQLLALAPPPRKTTAAGLPVPPPEPTYPSVTWELVYLMDGLTLMVNPARGSALRRIADDIYRYYGAPRDAPLPAPVRRKA